METSPAMGGCQGQTWGHKQAQAINQQYSTHIVPICSMVLMYWYIYLQNWVIHGDFVRANVGKYSSTMEHHGVNTQYSVFMKDNHWFNL